MVTVKSEGQIRQMRRAGRIVAELLALLGEELRPGIATEELDRVARRHMERSGAAPSFLGYLGGRRYGKGPRAYPGVICVSIDDEVVHGIPGRRLIEAGQLVSIDVAVAINGWHADGARTFAVGEVPPDGLRLAAATRMALLAGVAAARPGAMLSEISAAIEAVARSERLSVVEGLVGHGIGEHMHEDPDVPNERLRLPDLRLEIGHCLAIEPMFALGGPEARLLPDHWTVVTADGSRAAHFEHSIAVTADGAEILTTV